MRKTRQEIRKLVNLELEKLGLNPNTISNPNAVRLLGIAKGSLVGQSSAKLLRKWAEGKIPVPYAAFSADVLASHQADVVATFKANREKNKRRKKLKKEPKPLGKSLPARVVYKPSEINVTDDAFLRTYEWRRLRMEAIKRYGAKCQCCGATPDSGAVMNVDHIKPRRVYPELALSLENLQVLCHECNHGKGNWDMTDWRKEDLDERGPDAAA